MIFAYLKNLLRLITSTKINLDVHFLWNYAQLAGVGFIALLLDAIGSIVPVFLIVWAVQYLAEIDPRLVIKMNVNVATLITMAISIICGVVLAGLYVNKKFKEKNCTFTDVIALNLKSFNGNWKIAMQAGLLGYVVVEALGTVVEYLSKLLLHVKELSDPAAAYGSQLYGQYFQAFAGLTVFVAPVAEEIVFRGFILNSLATTFCNQWFRNHIFKTDTQAKYAAAVVSGFIFASAHMSPTGFFVLWFLGTALGIIYLRTGSLYCPIMVHMLNNASAMVLIGLRH